MMVFFFSHKIYKGIIDLDETWIITGNGSAMIVYDCQLLDC